MGFTKHYLPVRIVFGRKSLSRLGEEISYLSLDFSKVAVICGKSAVSNGYVDRIEDMLDAGIVVFDSVEPDPSIDNCKAIIEKVRKYSPDLIIAVGGGSAIDVAKVVSQMLTNDGTVEEFIGVRECFKKPGIPLVAVPTTSGSGSEVTPYAVLTDVKNWRKAPLISRYMFPVLAIDDPELTVSVPQTVTSSAGIDALTHAIESLVSKRATVVSRMFSTQAIALIAKYLPRAFGNPRDIEARENVMLASLLGGMAIADAGAGLVHTMSHVLGVMYKLPHGLSNAMFLVPVLRFYGYAVEREMKLIGRLFGIDTGSISEILERVEEFLIYLGKPRGLKDIGFSENDISSFINLVMEKKHLMGNLPRIPSERDIRIIVKGEL